MISATPADPVDIVDPQSPLLVFQNRTHLPVCALADLSATPLRGVQIIGNSEHQRRCTCLKKAGLVTLTSEVISEQYLTRGDRADRAVTCLDFNLSTNRNDELAPRSIVKIKIERRVTSPKDRAEERDHRCGQSSTAIDRLDFEVLEHGVIFGIRSHPDNLHN
jgi:hypothetical protein